MESLFERFGFSSKWRNWMVTCWKAASFFILINGSPRKSFRSSQGLRLGDPLSPMLFVLAVELLTWILVKDQNIGEIHGFKVTHIGLEVPLLQFTDDMLLYLNGSKKEVAKVKDIFKWFELYTGLKINTRKFILYQVSTLILKKFVGAVIRVLFWLSIWANL